MTPDALLGQLSKRQRQGLAVGILVLLLALAWTVIVAPVFGWFADHHRALALIRARAETAQQIAARGPGLAQKLEDLKASGVLKASLFAQPGDPNPAVKLQTEARRLLGASGAQIVNSQILPEASEQGFRRLALRVTLHGPLSKLQKAIYGLEAAKTPIFVHELTIRSPHAAPRLGNAPMPAADLTLILELHAYMEAGS